MLLGKYDDKRIRVNFLVVRVLSAISLAFSVLVGIANCFDLFSLDKIATNMGMGLSDKIFYLCLFYLILIGIPLIHLFNTSKSYRWFPKQTAINNDMGNLIGSVCVPFYPFWLLIFGFCNGIPWAYFGDKPLLYEETMLWARTCGIYLAAHLLVLIADGFLLYNLVLIKRAWQKDPPMFIIDQRLKSEKEQAEAQQKIAEEKNQQHEMNAEAVYAQNIEICGVRFFIKYYRAVNSLPLPDIEVAENYSPTERSERLAAAKRIVTAGAAECAFRKILDTYSDILLNASEIEQIQSILKELENSTPSTVPAPEEIRPQATEITYLQKPIKALMVFHTIVLCLAWIPAAWTIPMTVYYFMSVKKHRRVGFLFGTLTLIFLNIVAGALILCDAAKMPSPENAEENAPAA